MTPRTDLLYPESTMGTFAAEAIGTVSPLSNALFRSTVDDILTEGGWDVSDREALDCWSASSRVPRDNWNSNPYWDDLQRWRTEHVVGQGGTSEKDDSHHVVVTVEYPTQEEERHRTLWLVIFILCIVNVAVFLVLVALSKHVGFRLTSLCREGVHEELSAVKVQIHKLQQSWAARIDNNGEGGSTIVPSIRGAISPDQGSASEKQQSIVAAPPEVPAVPDTGV